ncbi:DnaJ-like protein subfamily C member 17 [Formica fusca]
MDPYEILGVKNDATLAEIKKVYRKKSLTCHPDKNPHKQEAAAEFYKLSEAIKLLSDEKARHMMKKSLLKNGLRNTVDNLMEKGENSKKIWRHAKHFINEQNPKRNEVKWNYKNFKKMERDAGGGGIHRKTTDT